MKPRIYCDMDGVLCDFKTAALHPADLINTAPRKNKIK